MLVIKTDGIFLRFIENPMRFIIRNNSFNHMVISVTFIKTFIKTLDKIFFLNDPFTLFFRLLIFNSITFSGCVNCY